MQTGNEPVPIALGQRHECSTHDDVFYFIYTVAELPELVHSSSRLFERIVAGADGTHRGRLVAGVGLGAVLKVGVGATGAVDTYVASLEPRSALREPGRISTTTETHIGDMRAAMGLAHDGYDGDSRACSWRSELHCTLRTTVRGMQSHTDRLLDELPVDVFLVVLGDGGHDGRERRDSAQLVLL